MPIRNASDAEEVAATTLRQLGQLDATTTASGRDGGIDVVSAHAVAQVKAETVRTGRPVIQAIFGIAKYLEKQAYVFSLAGYTSAATEWADEADVRLYEFDLEGCARPVNAPALKAQFIRGPVNLHLKSGDIVVSEGALAETITKGCRDFGGILVTGEVDTHQVWTCKAVRVFPGEVRVEIELTLHTEALKRCGLLEEEPAARPWHRPTRDWVCRFWTSLKRCGEEAAGLLNFEIPVNSSTIRTVASLEPRIEGVSMDVETPSFYVGVQRDARYSRLARKLTEAVESNSEVQMTGVTGRESEWRLFIDRYGARGTVEGDGTDVDWTELRGRPFTVSIGEIGFMLDEAHDSKDKINSIVTALRMAVRALGDDPEDCEIEDVWTWTT